VAFTDAHPSPASDPNGEPPIDVARMVGALRASAPVIALAVAAVTLIVFAVSSATAERFRATARIVAGPLAASAPTADTDQRRLATNVALLTTPDVLGAAARSLPHQTAAGLRHKLSTTIATDADVIDVTATDHKAGAAAAIANAVARAFLDRRAATARAGIAQARAALTAQLTQLGAGGPAAADQATAIRDRLSELVVDEANAGDDLELAEAAQAPSAPYAPRPLRNAAIALFAALFVAVLAVVLRERLRPRPGGPHDLERLSGVPWIAALPSIPAAPAPPGPRAPPVIRGLAARRAGAREVERSRVLAAADDAVRTLLGTVLLALPPRDRRVILVTSTGPADGTARVAASLARGLAQADQNTLALSTAVASDDLARALGVPSTPGLSQALARARADASVRLRAAAVPGVPKLHVVPGGGAPQDGVGLLRPGVVDALFEALAGSPYDYVVVEAPGLLGAPEAWLVARHADAAVLACAERASAEQLSDARRTLERLDVRVLGAVTTSASPAAAPEGAEPARPTREQVAANGAASGRLLHCLRSAEEPLTFGALRVALGDPSASTLRAHLRRLVDGGEVVRTGTGRSGDPYLYGAVER
jgi:capsular polysaccharide biosynthesis protein/Mrp family chromosome partitioning ATPase